MLVSSGCRQAGLKGRPSPGRETAALLQRRTDFVTFDRTRCAFNQYIYSLDPEGGLVRHAGLLELRFYGFVMRAKPVR